MARATDIGTDGRRCDVAAVEPVLQDQVGLRSEITCVSPADIGREADKILDRLLAPKTVDQPNATGAPIGEDLQPPGAAWAETETAQALLALTGEVPCQDLALIKLSDQKIHHSGSLRRQSGLPAHGRAEKRYPHLSRPDADHRSDAP